MVDVANNKSIKYLMWVIIWSIFYKNVLSEVCHNWEYICLKLCCDKWKFYNLVSHQCEDILPESGNISWTKEMQLAPNWFKTVNIVNDFEHEVHKPCKQPRKIENDAHNYLQWVHIFGDYCFSPHQLNGEGQYILLPLHRQCNESEYNPQIKSLEAIINSHLLKYFIEVAVALSLLLPTFCIYGFIKELRENIQSKLFICYGICMLIPFVLTIPKVYNHYRPFLDQKQTAILTYTAFYFGISSVNWSNAICFEMRRTFSRTNTERDVKKDMKRFIWYSIYVWGLSLILTSLTWYFTFDNIADVVMTLFFVFHLVIFFTLSFDICRIRLKVAKLKEGKQSIWKSVCIIIRLSALMGLSQFTYWVVCLICDIYGATFVTTMHITNFVVSVDAVIILILFVMRRSVRNMVMARLTNCCKNTMTSQQNV
ncbi:putative G-protein coupled receptor Mth-like 10 [Haematobia irritans]|uniref:putative G-protein coupled receptor Mth-like 10 n=1 Tax=Haematobia irritans TaxID=7368 RepID=UPI003F4F49FB